MRSLVDVSTRVQQLAHTVNMAAGAGDLEWREPNAEELKADFFLDATFRQSEIDLLPPVSQHFGRGRFPGRGAAGDERGDAHVEKPSHRSHCSRVKGVEHTTVSARPRPLTPTAPSSSRAGRLFKVKIGLLARRAHAGLPGAAFQRARVRCAMANASSSAPRALDASRPAAAPPAATLDQLVAIHGRSYVDHLRSPGELLAEAAAPRDAVAGRAPASQKNMSRRRPGMLCP